MNKQVVFVLTLSCIFSTTLQADDMAALKAEGRSIIQSFFEQLKSTLQTSMKEGGPGNAIKACNTKAPKIAAEISKNGWEVARTSLKLRNSNNAPDEWEVKVLKRFEERKAKGESIKEIDYAEIVKVNGQRSFRMMKAIPTDKICTNCHGINIKPDVTEILNKHYPNDKARGFKQGDIRGAFTLIKTL